MKTASLAIAVAVVAAGPALAKPTDAARLNQPHAQSQVGSPETQAPAMKRDPYGVYVNGKEIARDPDPNIRRELLNEYYLG